MEYPITYHGREVGTLQAVSDGLYWQLTAWCEPFAGGVQRLYGAERGRAEPFGVFAPNGKELHLHRRLSKQSCPTLPALWTAGRETDRWRPWRGVVEEQTVSDALLRPEPEGGCSLAIFAPTEGPIPLAEYVSAMTEGELQGRACMILRLTEKGDPLLPPSEDLPEEGAPDARTEEEPPLHNGQSAGADADCQPSAADSSSTSSTGQWSEP